MKRTLILLVLIAGTALPAFAQHMEIGVIAGGSRRFVEGAPREEDVVFDDSTFSLSNTAIDLYWGFQIEPDTWIKIKGGRIEGPVAVGYNIEGEDDR
ncbi:MAG TPA: hypothetical protein VHK90_16145, partial [Thermoanaerobaculia bacterium]|nr:hypothetical protein [Thermoanaerobaculia bacterium]